MPLRTEDTKKGRRERGTAEKVPVKSPYRERVRRDQTEPAKTAPKKEASK